MHDLISALLDPRIGFLRYAFLAGILASISFGIMGSYVVARRISYIAGAISHSVLGGIGAAIYLKHALGFAWCDPLLGATAAALLSALIIGWCSLYAGEREDTVIGAVWVIGMAVGLLFLYKAPGNYDAMSFLFGNILLVSARDLVLVIVLDALVVAMSLFFHNKLVAICFDEEFARLRGVRVEAYYLLLLCLTALTVVLLITVVGAVLVIALLTLPAATAGRFARRMGSMMILSVFFCAAFVASGLSVSYVYDTVSGPAIVLIGALTYLAVVALGLLRRSLPRFSSGRSDSSAR